MIAFFGMGLLGSGFVRAMRRRGEDVNVWNRGLADTFALAKALGIPPTDVAALFDSFNPGALVPARAKRMLDGDFEHPSWSLAMARTDTRLMLEEAQRGGVPLTVIPAIATAMDRVIAQGHAGADWTVIAKDALSR